MNNLIKSVGVLSIIDWIFFPETFDIPEVLNVVNLKFVYRILRFKVEENIGVMFLKFKKKHKFVQKVAKKNILLISFET